MPDNEARHKAEKPIRSPERGAGQLGAQPEAENPNVTMQHEAERPNGDHGDGIEQPNGDHEYGIERPNGDREEGVERPNITAQHQAKRPDSDREHGFEQPNGDHKHDVKRPADDNPEDKVGQPDSSGTKDGDKEPNANETTDGDEDPPMSDIINTPALSAMDTGIGSVDHKRKLPISPTNACRTAHKFPRTTHVWVQSDDAQKTYRNGNNVSRVCASASETAAATHSSFGSHKDCLEVQRKARSGASQSAIASQKLRREVASGSYVVREKRFKSWKEKITKLDLHAQFDHVNPRKVLHSRCSTWILVKEPGDTTRFKQHVETCQAKPVPAGGTLMGMGWLKAKENVETKKVRGKDEVKMPCRGVSDVDNLLVDRYLRRTGAGGGGGRGIHVISRDRFKKEFKYLTRAQKEVVQATQRAEWVWRNNHQSLRVHAINCERFTSSCSIASSLCTKCKQLLSLHAFTVAIQKKVPLDKNLKYINKQYLNPVLAHLYAKVKGLRAIIEHPVSKQLFSKLPG